MTRSRWRAEISGPQMVPGSVGSPAGSSAMVAAVCSTASSKRLRGTTRRVVIAHPCPAWVHTVKAAMAVAPPISASSRMTKADLPPSSKNTFFKVAEASAMTLRPVAVDPVKLIWSTRGSVESSAPSWWSDEVTTLKTPAGMSVSSATRRPSTDAHHGVSGAGFNTTVAPAARAGPTLARLIWWGTFQGEMAPTTPPASLRIQRCERIPSGSAMPRSCSHS